jgi:pimeloyl-ACP methyl ester carboxylesterase
MTDEPFATAPEVVGGYASTVRGRFHFWESGAGHPLVLLPPVPRSGRVYRRLLPLLPGFHCYALDPRGFGNSPSPVPEHSMADFAEDVVGLIDALGIAKAHVFGLHMGNKIAAALAAGWPDRVDRVVLAGRSHSIVPDMVARNAGMLAWLAGAPGPADHTMSREELIKRWSSTFTDVTRRWWDAPVLTSDGLDPEHLRLLSDEVIDEASGWEGVDVAYRANFEFDLAGALAAIQAPTLVIELVTEETAQLGAQAPLLQKLLAHSQLVALEEHDRSLLRDHPERLASVLVEFLS